MPNFSGLYRVDDSFALSLITAFLAENGSEALEWEPETIRLEIKADFGVDPSQVVMDKVQAAISLLTTDQFYTYWEPFEEMIHVFNDYEADFETMRPPTPEELAWGVIEAHLIDHEDEAGKPLASLFSPEVKGYVVANLHQAGFYRAPEALQFVDMEAFGDPKATYPELKDDIEDMHQIKHLRVQAYVADQYHKLNQELLQYFGKGLPSLGTILEREIAWR